MKNKITHQRVIQEWNEPQFLEPFTNNLITSKKATIVRVHCEDGTTVFEINEIPRDTEVYINQTQYRFTIFEGNKVVDHLWLKYEDIYEIWKKTRRESLWIKLKKKLKNWK